MNAKVDSTYEPFRGMQQDALVMPAPLLLALCLTASTAAPTRVVSLDEALQTAFAQQPNVRVAAANTAQARGLAMQYRGVVLPQLSGTASYQRTTANFVARPGYVPASSATAALADTKYSGISYNFVSLGVTLTQIIWDFGASWNAWRSYDATVAQNQAQQQVITLIAALNVRNAFFTARADKAQIKVALETMANLQHHLEQTEGYIQVGTHPEIDLAQARTNLANAKVTLINNQTTYQTDKLLLNQAMGVEGPVDYDVADEDMPPLDVEDAPIEQLMTEAESRPDFEANRAAIRSQELLVKSYKGSYWPVIQGQAQLTDQGGDVRHLGFNWSVGAALTWNIFQGGQQAGAAQAALAHLEALLAQNDATRQSIRAEVDRTRLQIISNKEALKGADEAVTNARLQLSLAEGRYETGIGNMVELSDSQLAYTNAALQRVDAELNLFSARSALFKALGRT